MILLSDDHAQNLINKSIEVQVVVSGVGTSIV